MSTLQERINEVMTKTGMTVGEIAAIAQVSSSAVTQWKDGPTQTIKTAPATRLAEHTGFPALWLATGEGASSPPAASNIQDAPYSRPNLRNLQQVPVIGTTQGGFPDRIWTDGDFPPGDSDSYAECSTADENAFLCRVVGDSMAPRYRPGEFCLVEPNTEAEIEDDVLVRLVTGETMLKRLLGLRGGLRLGSYNDATVYTYEPGEVRWYYYVAHGVPARKIKHRIETATYSGRDRRWVDAPGHPARRTEDAKVDQPAAGQKPAA
jgi:phage repressor protein C with HTH and peptisase S24 domain